jgi:hypothetical protein
MPAARPVRSSCASLTVSEPPSAASEPPSAATPVAFQISGSTVLPRGNRAARSSADAPPA